jgi:hypothetical protein
MQFITIISIIAIFVLQYTNAFIPSARSLVRVTGIVILYIYIYIFILLVEVEYIYNHHKKKTIYFYIT